MLIETNERIIILKMCTLALFHLILTSTLLYVTSHSNYDTIMFMREKTSDVLVSNTNKKVESFFQSIEMKYSSSSCIKSKSFMSTCIIDGYIVAK